MSCNDFNNDGLLDIDDVYILFAYTQILKRPVFLRPNPIGVSHVQAEYNKLFPNGTAIVAFSPADSYVRSNGNSYLDYTDDGIIDIDDVYIYFAYTQILKRPVFLRPHPIEASHVQAEYNKLFPSRTAIVVYIPELVCVTPTPTPTPTHCYNHPDYVLNITQNTFHCSIQGAVDMADDSDVLQLTSGVEYESPVNITGSSPKGISLIGTGNLITGGDITVEDNTVTIDNISLSGSNLILNNTLSSTEIKDCTFEQSRIVANVVDELLLHDNTFVDPCVLSTDWAVSVHAVNTHTYTELYNNTINIPTTSLGNGIHITSNTQSYCKLDMNTLNNCDISIMLTRQDFTLENNILTTSNTGVIVDQPPAGTSGSIRQNVFRIETDVLTIQNNSKPYRIDASYNYIQNYSANWLVKAKDVAVDTSPRYTNDSKTSLVN